MLNFKCWMRCTLVTLFFVFFQFRLETINSLFFFLSSIDRVRDFDDLFVNVWSSQRTRQSWKRTEVWRIDDENDENDEKDEENFCKSTRLWYLRRSLNVEDIWHLIWWNDRFLKVWRFFRKLAFESRCERIIKTIETCKDIASLCMMKERFFLQIFEHACDVH